MSENRAGHVDHGGDLQLGISNLGDILCTLHGNILLLLSIKYCIQPMHCESAVQSSAKVLVVVCLHALILADPQLIALYNAYLLTLA